MVPGCKSDPDILRPKRLGWPPTAYGLKSKLLTGNTKPFMTQLQFSSPNSPSAILCFYLHSSLSIQISCFWGLYAFANAVSSAWNALVPPLELGNSDLTFKAQQ